MSINWLAGPPPVYVHRDKPSTFPCENVENHNVVNNQCWWHLFSNVMFFLGGNQSKLITPSIISHKQTIKKQVLHHQVPWFAFVMILPNTV